MLATLNFSKLSFLNILFLTLWKVTQRRQFFRFLALDEILVISRKVDLQKVQVSPLSPIQKSRKTPFFDLSTFVKEPRLTFLKKPKNRVFFGFFRFLAPSLRFFRVFSVFWTTFFTTFLGYFEFLRLLNYVNLYTRIQQHIDPIYPFLMILTKTVWDPSKRGPKKVLKKC